MSSAQAKIFDTTRRFSSMSVASVVLLSLVFERLISQSSITWQVVVALIALAVGIPHGALDHLVTLPRASIKRIDRKSTRLNSSHVSESRMPSSA